MQTKIQPHPNEASSCNAVPKHLVQTPCCLPYPELTTPEFQNQGYVEEEMRKMQRTCGTLPSLFVECENSLFGKAL